MNQPLTKDKQRNSVASSSLHKADFEIELIRRACSRLLKAVNRQTKRGVMAYDWGDYGQPELFGLCELLKVNFVDGKIKKKDKRGYWR